jgi:hypothetical protein
MTAVFYEAVRIRIFLEWARSFPPFHLLLSKGYFEQVLPDLHTPLDAIKPVAQAPDELVLGHALPMVIKAEYPACPEQSAGIPTFGKIRGVSVNGSGSLMPASY